MRFTIGMIGTGLCLMSAIAAAQTPGATAPRRGATLLPPEPVYQAAPTIARAAAEELGEPAMTPVTRSTRTANGPGWLNGTDAGVRPAGGTTPSRNTARPTPSRTEPTPTPKSFDKLKEAFGTGDRSTQTGRTPGGLPAGMAKVQPDASTAFRGTSNSGAPVYAGPPAYRWYGWGSVTPGANPYAPTGQFPPASANWFSITGATPGAFPVPVTNPYRSVSGTEPPAYIAAPSHRVAPASASMMPAPAQTVRPQTPVHVPPATIPPPADLTRTEPPAAVSPAPTPTITPPPPIVVPGPAMPAVNVPGATEQEPPIRPATAIPTLSPLPAINVIDATPAPVMPAPLPVSVTEDKSSWASPNTDSSPGEWSPAGGKPSLPPAPATPAPNWGTPGTSLKPQVQPIARGQVSDTPPDPTVSLIRKLCEGRARNVEVRWTGSKKVSVSLECGSSRDAERLVREISARPELTPLQIDFSVLAR